MPIECIWRGTAYEDEWGPWQPGDCFYHGYYLSEHYKTNIATVRKPISVFVPARGATEKYRGTGFCIDSHPTGNDGGAWQVSVDLASLVIGQKPLITVSPSINCVGIYHGFLQAGVLTDDIGS